MVVRALAAALLLLLAAHAEAASTWQTLKIGAGGWLTGMDASTDGVTRVVRTDTYGAYRLSGSTWVQLATSASMPITTPGLGAGVYEIRVCPSDSTILYMAYGNYLYKSTNSGTTWTKLTGFATQTMDANSGTRYNGEKMAVDPANCNVVLVGTDTAGMWETTDGGTTFALNATLGTGVAINGIVFDPTSGTTGGRTNTIYAFKTSTGYYRSTNAGATWASIASGGPTGVLTHAAVAADGIFYAVQSANVAASIFKYSASTWSGISPGGQYFHSIAPDPNNSAKLIAGSDGGAFALSTDRGATWVFRYNLMTRTCTGDIPWLCVTLENYMSNGQQAFDPVVANKVWFSQGIGVWTSTSVSDTTDPAAITTWASISAGIEQLVSNSILSPVGGNVALMAWDRPLFGNATLTSFPSAHLVTYAHSIQMGWSLTAPPTNSAYICGLVNWFGTTQQSGCSTDRGVTWTLFAATPAFTDLGGSGTPIGGSLVASTVSNFLWLPSNKNRPYYSIDGGASWSAVTFPGVLNDATFSAGWGGLCFAYYLRCFNGAADAVTTNKFYVYLYGEGATNKGLFTSTDSGATWTQTYASLIGGGTGSNSKLKAPPGKAGHLFFTAGPQGSGATAGLLYVSTDSGATWNTVASGTITAYDFGYGTTKPGKTYPSIYVVGHLSGVYGQYQSDDGGTTWGYSACGSGAFILNSLDEVRTVEGDKNVDDRWYIGFGGSGFAYCGSTAGAGAAVAGKVTISGQVTIR